MRRIILLFNNIVYNGIMKIKETNMRHLFFRVTVILLIILILISCQPFTTTLAPVTHKPASATVTDTAIVPSIGPTQTAAPRTPPALPAIYQSAYINPLNTPRTYIKDTCQYLRNKWNPLNAQPGTVVMPILIHGITKGPVEDSGGMNVIDFNRMMQHLYEQGFQAIDTQQFHAFMERNVKIPPRSVLIIQDDRHHIENFDKNFREYWDKWGWPVINGWQSQPDTPESLWEENISLEKEGWVDHQAQGVMIGSYLTDDSSKAIITRELQGSINAFADHFGKTPIAFIWPGGGFGQRPVEAARQLGYQLGFTSNSRGPVMYNWVPLADNVDPNRPAFIPEGKIGDPLMTLPRYWPYEVMNAIDQVRILGKEAAAYAEANKATELEYYDIVCASTYGAMPTP